MSIIIFLCDLYGLSRLRQGLTNYASLNISILLETLFLAAYFLKVFASVSIKKILNSFLAVFILLWIFLFVKKGDHTILYTSLALESIFILFFAIYYYYENLFKIPDVYFYTEPRFWVVTAYFVYSAGTFFLLLYLPLFNLAELMQNYLLNYIFLIIRTILLTTAMFMKSSDENKKNFKIT